MYHRRTTLLIVLIGLLAGFVWISSAMAGIKVAVFPFLDLTYKDNGINWQLTEQFQHDLEEKGMDVLSRQAVISFMALHRIRVLGQLESYHINLARKELGVQLILLGTICQSSHTPAPSLTVAIYLIRATDGRTIWSNVEDICCFETKNLLGLWEPKSIDEISPMLSHNMLSTWPTDFTAYTNKQNHLDIKSAWLRPIFVHSGEEIKCSVHLRNIWSSDKHPSVFFKIGEKIFPTTETTSFGIHETSWIAEGAEGRYPVSLLSKWPDGNKDVSLLGSYFIDDQPPTLDLELKGTKLRGKTTFSGRVVITPLMHVREPITRWRLTIESNKGVIIYTKETKGFPPQHLIWKGTGQNRRQVRNDDYRVTMQLWDRAENTAKASQWLTILRKKTQIEVQAEIIDQELIIKLLHEKDIPITFWQLKFRSANGVILKISDGNNFPARIVFPLAAIKGANKKISGEITIQDILGNQTNKIIENFMTLGTGDEETDQNEAWTEEF